MIITANKLHGQDRFFRNGKKIDAGISVFYRDEIQTDKGLHVGVVLDKPTHIAARICLYDWALTNRKKKDGLLNLIFGV